MKKIVSLQALRGLCYIGIFLFHVGYENLYGHISVSVFFILSGFMSIYTYKNKDEKLTFKNSFKYAVSRIKKIYLLHLITTLIIFILDLFSFIEYHESFSPLYDLLTKLVANLTLAKALIPSFALGTSLNGVSWFLATSFFIYLTAPYLIRFVNKHGKMFLVFSCFVLFLLQIISCIPVFHFFGIYSDISDWYVFHFPLCRLAEFFYGLVIGKYYQDIINFRINVVIRYVLFIALLGLSYHITFISDPYDNIYLSAVLNLTSKHAPIAVGWLIYFLRCDIIFVKLLNNEFLQNLGDLSMYTYLIHNTVIICFYSFGMDGYFGNYYLIVIFLFIATLLLSKIYKYIEDALRNNKKQRLAN